MGSPLAAVLAARTGVSTSPLAVRSIRAQLEVLALAREVLAFVPITLPILEGKGIIALFGSQLGLLMGHV